MISAADWSDTTPAELLEAHLNRSANTARAYRADMWTFCEFLGAAGEVEAVEFLVNLSRGAARRTMDNYLNHLRKEGRSLNTIRRKIASVLGLLRMAHEYDIIHWMIKVTLPAPLPVRDTRGPGRNAVTDMIEICEQRGDSKGTRDAAIVRLMFSSALRCNEVLTLDVKHFVLDLHEIEILGKGLWERTRLPITRKTALAVTQWLDFRGFDDGPLFISLKPGKAHDGERLTYWGAYYIITTLGRKVDVHCSPHGLRHTAASEMMRLSNGNVHWGMALTRHRDPKTLMIYNDQRMNQARQAMEILEAGFPIIDAEALTQDNY